MIHRRPALFLVTLAVTTLCPLRAAIPKKIVLIAGKKSHGPGAHEYVKSVKLLKVMLDRSPNLSGAQTEIHFNGWPEDPRTLDTADTIMTISDGQDGDRYSPVPFLTPERMRVMEKQMNRGCGFITFHFSTFAPDSYGAQMIEWGGGYFGWQDSSGARNWYSKIKTVEADVALTEIPHPITQGVKPFQMKEEFYYKIRFGSPNPRLTPIAFVPALGADRLEAAVAWAVQRTNGGRGFSTTTGHFYDHWKNPDYRKMILNGIAWTAHLDIPPEGVESTFVEDNEVDRALVPNPIQTLLVTGDNHPSHKWKETTTALIEALQNRGPQFEITVTENPEDLAKPLRKYGLIVLNYCNWTSPGLSDAAKARFVHHLRRGGGLAIIHFANGAFHSSLPNAPPSDWPEYRKIAARVWDGSKDQSGHDRYGPIRVNITNNSHPVTRDMESFDAFDELYFRQEGDTPITVLATAHSETTGYDEPMAFVYRYGRARVFQTVLGHSKESLSSIGEIQLIRRGSLWAARKRR